MKFPTGNCSSEVGNISEEVVNSTTNEEVPFFVIHLASQIGLIILYTTTVLLAITGNVLVVIVFTKGKGCRTDIRPFLINLAIADLIMAVFCLPFTFSATMLKTWVFSKPMCPVVLSLQHLSVSASVFTNMAIGTDRFLAVTFPLRSRLAASRAKLFLAGIWIFSIGLASVQLFVSRATDVFFADYHFIVCDEMWDTESARRTFTLFVLFITYIIPLCILSVTYTIVGVLLWRRTSPGNADQTRDSNQLQSKRKVVKMLIIIILMFGLCWLPLHTFFLVIDFNPELLNYETTAQEEMFTAIYYCVHWLAMSNSFANPIIYGFLNESFRADLASICYLWFPCCKCLKRVATRRYSVSTNDTRVQRQNAVRKNQSVNVTKQSLRNGHKVYFELRRSISKEDETSRRVSTNTTNNTNHVNNNNNRLGVNERTEMNLSSGELSSDDC